MYGSQKLHARPLSVMRNRSGGAHAKVAFDDRVTHKRGGLFGARRALLKRSVGLAKACAPALQKGEVHGR